MGIGKLFRYCVRIKLSLRETLLHFMSALRKQIVSNVNISLTMFTFFNTARSQIAFVPYSIYREVGNFGIAKQS